MCTTNDIKQQTALLYMPDSQKITRKFESPFLMIFVRKNAFEKQDRKKQSQKAAPRMNRTEQD